MLNLTTDDYPYYTYAPLRFGAAIFAIFIYGSLVGWFVQSLNVKCRPTLLIIFIFVTHLVTFIELILRATLRLDQITTPTIFRVTAPLLSVGPRILLFANYHFLVQLRGKKPRGILDRIIDILVPIGAMTGDILLTVANELSFKPHRFLLSFYFRQASAAVILFLAIFFYVVWFLAVPHSRRRHVFILLLVSSAAVLIEAAYIQIGSIRSFFFSLNHNEFWFYVGHLVPLTFALVTWTIFHPSRLLPPSETSIPDDPTSKELLSVST